MGRAVCLSTCVCVSGTILTAASIFLLSTIWVHRTYFGQYEARDLDKMPGDFLRRKVQKDILAAFKTGDWTPVRKGITENNFALAISNASGLAYETSRGWISLDKNYGVSTESTMIAALAIYRLMQKHPALLSPSTRARKYISSWPSRPNQKGSNVTLQDLLSYTTGFGPLSLDNPGCATLPRSQQPSWQECVDEIAGFPFSDPPGESFQYGPWHLVIAAAMAQIAVGRDLTMESWTRTVKEEVYSASGLSDAPLYAGSSNDYPLDEGHRFPDFSGGLRMNGRQWQRIIQALQFGNLLTKANFAEFIRDHTTHVKRVVGDLEGQSRAMLGMWHFAQGEWITCDEAGAKSAIGVEQENTFCGGASGMPKPQVLHSVGMFGFYVWMDLTNNYNGIFVHSWVVDLLMCLYITIGITVVFSPLLGIGCGLILYRREIGGKPVSCSDDEESDELEAFSIQEVRSESDKNLE